uniref:TGF-beta propeptide domain-containing protein n=1 Tax=Callorhinchus milii TaxID=7868 RepID=A0A4W3GVE3_CALMI
MVMLFGLPLLLLLEMAKSGLGLSTCKTLDMAMIKKQRIEAIRGQILSKLKMDKPPAAQDVTVPNEVMTLYNSTKESLNEVAKENATATDPQTDYYAKQMFRFNTVPTTNNGGE